MYKRCYRVPDELPGGWWDVVAPVVVWIKGCIADAYKAGYQDGKADATADALHILEDMRNRHGKPPTGAAPAVSIM